ncbi:lipocalin family protein [uncultured Bacteroides sp.]|uniref:lipocalin family protein n=1 Tax=uncultured Bacteroides sp. TaxID=162156 RepID=UPI0025FA7C80|nr:lipocalin family protein [uncultured Bacteroides sp.]
MKKFELKFWLSCMVMALCVGFTSCSDDDDEGIAGDAKTLIIGTWQSTWNKGYEIYDGEKEEWDEAYTDEVYTFKKDGTGTYKDEYDNSTDPFTWSVSGNKLKLTYDDNDSDEVVIKTLNENTAVLVVQYKDKDTEYYDEMTFKKK